MAKIEYKSGILDILNNLSKIRQSILLEKKDEKLSVENRNGLSTIQYHLTAPIEYFNIDGDELGIFNYPEFHKLVESFEKSSFEQREDCIIIRDGGEISENTNAKSQTIKYSLSDSTTVKAVLEDFEFNNDDIKFKFESDEMKKINKVISGSYVNSDVIQLSTNGNELKLNTFNESGKSKSKWEEVYPLDEEPEKDVIIKFHSDTFRMVPDGSYDITMNNKCIKFSLINNEISLDLIIKKI